MGIERISLLREFFFLVSLQVSCGRVWVEYKVGWMHCKRRGERIA